MRSTHSRTRFQPGTPTISRSTAGGGPSPSMATSFATFSGKVPV